MGKEIAFSARAASILTSVLPHQRPAAGSVGQTDTRQWIMHSAFAGPIIRALRNEAMVLMTASATLGTSVSMQMQMAVRHALPARIREILAVTSAPVAPVANIRRLLRRLL